MFYIISVLLIIIGIGLAIYGEKKYNISLAISFIVPNLAFLYYIDEALNGLSYIKYGYYTILVFGLLILLFAKVFTYIYSFFTLWFLVALVWASIYAILDIDPENYEIEAWSILLITIIVLVLVRKSIKRLVIGMGSGYMIGIGIAAIGFKSILNMGWGYILDAIYLPGLTIFLFTFVGISYQYYLNKSEQENPMLSKKQVNLYFGGGSGIIAILLIFLPILLKTSPQKNAKKLARSYCECAENIMNNENHSNIEDICKDEIGFSNAIKSISSIDDVTIFTNVFTEEITHCLEKVNKKTNKNIISSKEKKEQNRNNKIKKNRVRSQNNNYNKFLGRYKGDFGMDTAILSIENIDDKNGLVTGYIKTLGEYQDSQILKGPFKVVNDFTALRIAMSDKYTTYEFYVNGETAKGDAKDTNGEIMYTFSLTKVQNQNKNQTTSKTFSKYKIQIKEGVTNVNVRDSYIINQSQIITQVSYPQNFTVLKEHFITSKNNSDLYLLKNKSVLKDINSGQSYSFEAGKKIKVIQKEGQLFKAVINIGDKDIFVTLPALNVETVKDQKWLFLGEVNGWILSDFVSNNIKKIYYKIHDNDGYSNLRKSPNGSIIQKVYENERFEVISTESNYKKVKLEDGTIGYIHESRVIKLNTGISNSQNISLVNQNKQVILLETVKYKIRIDDLGNSSFRYSAWPSPSLMKGKPDLIINGGKLIKDGSGGNYSYIFMNGAYKYECLINILGTDETPPAQLLVYKNEDLILSQPALIK